MIRKITLVILLMASFSIEAAFIHVDFTLSQYQEIRSSDQNNEYWKSQRIGLEGRATGIYFSVYHEQINRLLIENNRSVCGMQDSVNIEDLFEKLDQEILINEEFHLEQLFTKAFREIIKVTYQC